MTEVLCRAANFDSPSDAMAYHLQRFDQISYNQTIRPIAEHAYVLRKQHPSIFMLPFATDIANPLMSKYPPLLITSGKRGISTISDPATGTLENLYLIKKSVVNQVLFGEAENGYTCPLCKEVINNNTLDHQCKSGASLLNILPFGVQDIRWPESWDFN